MGATAKPENGRTRRSWLRAPVAVFVALFVTVGWLESSYSRTIEQQQQEQHQFNISSSAPILSFKFMVENSTLRSGGVEQPQQQQPSVPEPQQQQQIKKEEPLWYRLGFRSCRMPEFYDPSRHRYDLTNMDASGDAWIDAGWGRRHQLKVQAQQQQNEPIEDNTNEYYQMMLRKDQPHSPFQNLAIARNISPAKTTRQ